jgi:transcriptional regulator with XRE-family HTH domain
MLLNIVGAIKSIEFGRQKESLGTRLKKLREEKNVSQKEIADYLGVGRSAVANWEADTAEPNSEKLRKISAYFKVSIDFLLDNDF